MLSSALSLQELEVLGRTIKEKTHARMKYAMTLRAYTAHKLHPLGGLRFCGLAIGKSSGNHGCPSGLEDFFVIKSIGRKKPELEPKTNPKRARNGPGKCPTVLQRPPKDPRRHPRGGISFVIKSIGRERSELDPKLVPTRRHFAPKGSQNGPQSSL